MKRVVAIFLSVAALWACSSNGGSQAADGGGTGGSGGSTSSGGVTLLVASASSPYQIANTSPSGGDAFEELDITLQNASSARPVSVDFALFTLGTDQSLVLQASPLSSAVAPECSPTTSVAMGGSFTCKLAFEVPTGQKATRLYYDDKQGHQASVPVPAPPPISPACEQAVSIAQKALQEAQTNPNGPCVQCLVNAQSSQCNQGVDAGNGACSDTSDKSCDNTCRGDAGPLTLPDDFCSCLQSCATPSCWAATVDFDKCVVNACASSCP